jgi:tripartite-type tricarboxylate transporter receptor subunit TctC
MKGNAMLMLRSIRRTLPLAAAAGLMLASSASAQDYPARTINMVVGFAAGGSADVIARQVSQRLSDRIGRNIIIENRGGAAGNIAAKLVSNAAPDGYTLLATTSSLAVSETVGKNKGFSVKDLRPVAIVAFSPYAIAVHPSNPAMNLKEFIANGKEKSFTYASAGVGSGPHIGAEYFFRKVVHVKAVHVPFTGGAPALAALLGGHVDAMVITLPTVEPGINQKTLRGLGLASEARYPSVPQLPTLAESGYKIYQGSWIGFFAPAKTPDAVVAKLNTEINRILKNDDIQKVLNSIGFDVTIKPLPEATEFFKSEVATWGEMVQAIGFAGK